MGKKAITEMPALEMGFTYTPIKGKEKKTLISSFRDYTGLATETSPQTLRFRRIGFLCLRRSTMAQRPAVDVLSTYVGFRFIGLRLFATRCIENVHGLAAAHNCINIQLENFVLLVFME
ncbi:hypothetical protein TNCV_1903951 [Trichonephila clavipes]|nr:hypothetical protein TNCV_1903951 [Trichonephila clavipes]